MIFALIAAALAGTMTVDVLDVGQGDSILITSPKGKTVLIDAGPPSADVVSALKSLGVEELTLLISTHPHADHIGDMEDVVKAFPVKVFTDNGFPHDTATYASLMKTVEEKGIPYKPARVGQTYKLDDGIVLTVLNPGTTPLTDTRSDLNSNSVVVRVDHGDDCFLFVGDSEEPTEHALMSRGLGQCDVLKVAHHGSNHSSTASFLATVDPDIALISVGEGNRYKHPGEETIERLQRQGAVIYRTDYTGHIRLESTGRGITVSDGIAWWSPPPADKKNTGKSD